jgi:hypothetical protein
VFHVDAQQQHATSRHDQRHQDSQRFQALDSARHDPHPDCRQGNQRRRTVPVGQVHGRVDELSKRVVALGNVAGRVFDHADHDLQGNAGREARHDRVGDETH